VPTFRFTLTGGVLGAHHELRALSRAGPRGAGDLFDISWALTSKSCFSSAAYGRQTLRFLRRLSLGVRAGPGAWWQSPPRKFRETGSARATLTSPRTRKGWAGSHDLEHFAGTRPRGRRAPDLPSRRDDRAMRTRGRASKSPKLGAVPAVPRGTDGEAPARFIGLFGTVGGRHELLHHGLSASRVRPGLAVFRAGNSREGAVAERRPGARRDIPGRHRLQLLVNRVKHWAKGDGGSRLGHFNS